jgi:hypothetical protein
MGRHADAANRAARHGADVILNPGVAQLRIALKYVFSSVSGRVGLADIGKKLIVNRGSWRYIQRF